MNEKREVGREGEGVPGELFLFLRLPGGRWAFWRQPPDQSFREWTVRPGQ